MSVNLGVVLVVRSGIMSVNLRRCSRLRSGIMSVNLNVSYLVSSCLRTPCVVDNKTFSVVGQDRTYAVVVDNDYSSSLNLFHDTKMASKSQKRVSSSKG